MQKRSDRDWDAAGSRDVRIHWQFGPEPDGGGIRLGLEREGEEALLERFGAAAAPEGDLND